MSCRRRKTTEGTELPVRLAAALALLAAFTAGLASPAAAGPPKPPLAAGPGAGFRTRAESMVRTLRGDYTATPILTAGDTLVSSVAGAPPFVFAGRTGGLAILDRNDGTAEVYVSHDFGRLDDLGGALVSRLLLDLRNAGVLAADYLVEESDRYAAFRHATLADARAGFLRPAFLVNEGSVDGAHHGVVTAVDVRDGTAEDLPWLGLAAHKSTLVVPVTAGKTVAVMTSGLFTGRNHLYMYVAGSEADFLGGAGRLYVFRPDSGAMPRSWDRSALSLSRGSPIAGAFIPLDQDMVGSPLSLESAAQDAGCLNFVRLEDLALDRERLDAFYFADAGGDTYDGIGSDPGALEGGRLYHVSLDPIDPTRVTSLEVILDGAQGDDLFRPSSLDTDRRSVMIQEDPGARGLHPARILCFDTRTHRLEAVAECAERDRKRRLLPRGVGGEWESSGILNVSDIWGEDSWLLTVQAHTLRAPQGTGRSGESERRGDSGRWGESGQLLLLRGSRYPRTESPAKPRTGSDPGSGPAKDQ